MINEEDLDMFFDEDMGPVRVDVRGKAPEFVNCICCGLSIKNWADALNYDEEMPLRGPASVHPMGGLAFVTTGHYGSARFDPMNGDEVTIVICDDCVGARIHMIYGQPDRGVHGDVNTYGSSDYVTLRSGQPIFDGRCEHDISVSELLVYLKDVMAVGEYDAFVARLKYEKGSTHHRSLVTHRFTTRWTDLYTKEGVLFIIKDPYRAMETIDV